MTEGQNGENAEITITFEKKAVYKDKVAYYSYDENFYLVTKTDGSQMLVNKMKVREMIEAFDRMIEIGKNKMFRETLRLWGTKEETVALNILDNV